MVRTEYQIGCWLRYAASRLVCETSLVHLCRSVRIAALIPTIATTSTENATRHSQIVRVCLYDENHRPYNSSTCTQYTASDVVPRTRSQLHPSLKYSVHRNAPEPSSKVIPSLQATSAGLFNQKFELE